MNSSVRIDNKNKDTLIFGKDPTKGLDNTILTAGKEYAISFSEQQRKLCLNLHYHGANDYLFVKVVEIHNFKANISKINATPLSSGNASNNFLVEYMKKQDYACVCVCVYNCSVDYNSTDAVDIFDICKYLIVKNNVMFCLIKQVFIALLSFSGSLSN